MSPSTRHPLLLRTCLFFTLFTVCFCDNTGQVAIIDNGLGNTQVRYTGPWTFFHPDDDPEGRNWMGTLSYGNISGAFCTIDFNGE